MSKNIETIELGNTGFQIKWDGVNYGSAALINTSQQKQIDRTLANTYKGVSEFDACMNGLETLILSQFCLGVDVCSSEYYASINCAIDAIAANTGDSERLALMPIKTTVQ